MEANRIVLVLMLCTLYLLRDGCADINPLTANYEATIGTNLKLIWNYDYEVDAFNVEWSFKNKTSSSPSPVMVKITPAAASVVEPNFNIKHESNGNVTIEGVKMDNEGTYYCSVEYTAAKYPPVIGTAVVTIATTSSTSAVSSTSTLTTTPSTATSVTSPTTSSTSTSTSTTSSVVSTLTTSILTQSAPSSSLTSTAISSTAVTSTSSSSNETTVIIISSVLGGLFLIGIVITIVLMLLSQRRGHHPARSHRHRDQDQRHKRRDNHRYPSWQDHGQYNNASYIEYPGMGTKMNPLYVPNRSAHRPEGNYYLDHPSTDHQRYTRNHQIYYGGYNSNVSLQTNMQSYKQRYYGGRGGNNISNTLPRDENNYVAPDYELYW